MRWGSSRPPSLASLFRQSSRSLFSHGRKSKHSDKDADGKDTVEDDDNDEPDSHRNEPIFAVNEPPAQSDSVIREQAAEYKHAADAEEDVALSSDCHLAPCGAHEQVAGLIIGKPEPMTRRPLSRHESIETQVSVRPAARARVDLGPVVERRRANAADNDRIYRESMAFLELRRARLAELRRRLHPVEPLKQYAKVADPLAVWDRSQPALDKRRRRRITAADRPTKSVVQDPVAVYRRSQAWRSEADLRRACATVDRDLDEMIGRGFLARAGSALSFGDWKTHTEYRFRRFFYDDIGSELAALLWLSWPSSSVW